MRTKRKRIIEINIETEEFYLLRGSRSQVAAWCAQCAADVRMVTADEAAAVTHVSSRTIYALVEDGKIHFTETPAGSLLVCLDSLAIDPLK